MSLLLVVVGAALVGLVVHAAAPGRDTRGLLLTPGVATAAAAGAWTVVLLATGAQEGAATWAVPAVTAVVVAVLVPVLTVRRRREADRQLFARLVRA